jgi:hypothetical protein
MQRKGVMLTLAVVVGIIVGMSANHVLIAQQEPVKRTVLRKTDLAGIDGKEGLVYLIEVAPGATVPKHYHPGHELAYLLEGSLTLEVEGKPAATLLVRADAHQLLTAQDLVPARQPDTFIVGRPER